ncbi:MAG: ATP-grasp domain-containing protein [Nitrospiraceae bacterium]|nr:ATP-grasp domain-containing protein [Nitrospiraceae bacterium]
MPRRKTSTPELNILVTSISKKVPLLKSLGKACWEISNNVKVFGADSDPNCIGKYFVDSFWEMPRIDVLRVEDLTNFCATNKISYIIPTRDGELLYFAKHKEKLLRKGIHVMISDYKAVEACLDKLLFYDLVNKMGFPAVTTTKNIEELNCDTYVVKERFGAGSNNIGLNLSKAEAADYALKLGNPIYQPMIQGREISADLYVDNKNGTKGIICRYRQLVINGESQISETLRNIELEEMCADFGGRLKFYGHIILQIIIDKEGNFHIIEANTRFGGASSLSVEAGLDSFYWFLLESRGEDLKRYPFLRAEKEKKLIRHAEDLVI